MRHRLSVFLFALVSACGGSLHAGENIPVGTGDLISYHASQLPDPIVVYAYTSKGVLLNVFGRHGDNGFENRARVSEAVRAGSLSLDASADVTAMDESFKSWVAHGNLDIGRIIDPASAYSLILVVPDTGAQPCPPCADYEKALREAMQSPAAKGRFSLYVLKLNAPVLKFETVD